MKRGRQESSFNRGFLKFAFQGEQFRCLKIPQSFVKHMMYASEKAILCGPFGGEYDVRLKYKGRKMYFARGWDDFAREHCLQQADLLVFLYEGNNKFLVSIFDKTACNRFPRLEMSSGSVKGANREKRQRGRSQRGRPPQPLLASDIGTCKKESQGNWQAQATKSCQMGTSQVKRPRGRPRKNPVQPKPTHVADGSESEPSNRVDLCGQMPSYDTHYSSFFNNGGLKENQYAWNVKGHCSQPSQSESWEDSEELY